MKIDLNSRELYKILSEKFGEASFALYCTETAEGFVKRTGKSLDSMERPPDIRQAVVFVDKDLTIIP